MTLQQLHQVITIAESKSMNEAARKLFDYYPLRMKLFDYRQWQQLTYPSLIEGTDKWETELDEIINRLMVAPQ